MRKFILLCFVGFFIGTSFGSGICIDNYGLDQFDYNNEIMSLEFLDDQRDQFINNYTYL